MFLRSHKYQYCYHQLRSSRVPLVWICLTKTRDPGERKDRSWLAFPFSSLSRKVSGSQPGRSQIQQRKLPTVNVYDDVLGLLPTSLEIAHGLLSRRWPTSSCYTAIPKSVDRPALRKNSDRTYDIDDKLKGDLDVQEPIPSHLLMNNNSKQEDAD